MSSAPIAMFFALRTKSTELTPPAPPVGGRSLDARREVLVSLASHESRSTYRETI